ncbi:hypothetical protein DDE01_23100 [Desulfovibrio desulfuricans]|uniref:hypothetical protein n=1 Tax=Nitratidesulfovibrio vulgaris TaxID=881 RepID=UPI0011445FD2|nr:hypothetical protein [Nitratidesulfovibrio vulgaris]WCB47086.1 hypothetical protein PH214_03130 [Nitratidesulfovibrio vulgaris]GEB80895.1 hypothetical protein DDE01_23100 [Desulfovibrio desulfuricans]
MLKTRFSTEEFEKNRIKIEIETNKFLVDHIVRVYKLFDGDITSAIILGAISFHTISNIAPKLNHDTNKISKVLANHNDPRIPPCNAYSISESTGIPRETVRRKIDKLVQAGFITKNTKAEVFFKEGTQFFFSHFSLETANNVLNAADKLREIIITTNNKL